MTIMSPSCKTVCHVHVSFISKELPQQGYIHNLVILQYIYDDFINRKTFRETELAKSNLGPFLMQTLLTSHFHMKD